MVFIVVLYDADSCVSARWLAARAYNNNTINTYQPCSLQMSKNKR